jgi:hypothetical protein
MSLWFSFNFTHWSAFFCAITPYISIAALPREETKKYLGGDFKYSITVAWLVFAVTVCFWKYNKVKG